MKQLCCIESSDVLSANPISMVHHPKSDEKNVGIPSKSPWKSSNSPCQRTTEIIRPFLFRPFIQVVPPQL